MVVVVLQSKFFWVLALVRDVRHRLTNIQGLCQVSSKKIQLTDVQSAMTNNNADPSFSSQVSSNFSIPSVSISNLELQKVATEWAH